MLSFLRAYDEYPDELTVKQAAYILQLTPQTVRQYIRQGRLECYQIGRQYIVPKSSVRHLIQASKKGLAEDEEKAQPMEEKHSNGQNRKNH